MSLDWDVRKCKDLPAIGVAHGFDQKDESPEASLRLAQAVRRIVWML